MDAAGKVPSSTAGKVFTALAVVIATFAAYMFVTQLLLPAIRPPSYEGIQIDLPTDPRHFIQPENELVQSVAAQWETASGVYYWVCTNIKYKPDYRLGSEEVWLPPGETILQRGGDCEDCAILLCSLLRAQGTPASGVRVVAGLVPSGDGVAGHAWVELWYQGQWLPLESATHGTQAIPFDYYASNTHPEVKRLFLFNDIDYVVL